MNDELVERFSVDDVRKASRAEVSVVGADSYILQVDVGFHRCEADVTEPMGDNKIQVEPAIGHCDRVSAAYHCSLIMSRKSRWYTILSNTEPRARPSCLLNVAENPKIGTAS